jgi:hypothetical protein
MVVPDTLKGASSLRKASSTALLTTMKLQQVSRATKCTSGPWYRQVGIR